MITCYVTYTTDKANQYCKPMWTYTLHENFNLVLLSCCYPGTSVVSPCRLVSGESVLTNTFKRYRSVSFITPRCCHLFLQQPPALQHFISGAFPRYPRLLIPCRPAVIARYRPLPAALAEIIAPFRTLAVIKVIAHCSGMSDIISGAFCGSKAGLEH